MTLSLSGFYTTRNKDIQYFVIAQEDNFRSDSVIIEYIGLK